MNRASAHPRGSVLDCGSPLPLLDLPGGSKAPEDWRSPKPGGSWEGPVSKIEPRVGTMNPQSVGGVAPASWTAVMSEANHRFALGLAAFSLRRTPKRKFRRLHYRSPKSGGASLAPANISPIRRGMELF